jgi:hypothetical protein
MKAILRLHKIILSCLLMNVCFSCSRQASDIDELFNTVENIVEQQPDSALSLLYTILFPENLKQSQYNKFLLLQTQAKDKSYKDITSDTIIFEVKNYYVQKKDYPNATLAAYYCGRVLHEQKKAERAGRAYLEAEELSKPIENDNLKGLIQGNLSILYREQLLIDEAIVRGKSAANWYNNAGNQKNEINTLILIGNCYLLNNGIDSAFYFFTKSLSLADYFKMPIEQTYIRQSIGVAYRNVKMYSEAKKMFREALSFLADSTEQARTFMNLAKVYYIENQIDSAKFYATHSLSFKVKDSELLISMYSLLSVIEEKLGHYYESLQYHKEYNNCVKKIVDDNKNKALLELQKKYDFEKLKNDNNDRVIKQQKITITFFIAFIIVLLIAFFFSIKWFKGRKLLLEAEQKIESIKKMGKNYSKDDNSVRNILLHYFNILKKVALIEINIKEEDKNNGAKLIRKFNKIVYEQDSLDWRKLYQIINSLHDGLYDKVREMYPQLNDIEFRLCYLSGRKNFSDEEISVIMGVSTAEKIRKMRSNIRAKIKVPPYQDIHAFFIEKVSNA